LLDEAKRKSKKAKKKKAKKKAASKRGKNRKKQSRHHANYDAPEGSARDKHLDSCKAKLKRADKLEKEGKKAEAEKLRQEVYIDRKKEEEKYQ